MDEKRGEEFDVAEADDFFGDDEEDQEELGRPTTMAKRCDTQHNNQTVTASHVLLCMLRPWFGFLVSSLLGPMKGLGEIAACAYLWRPYHVLGAGKTSKHFQSLQGT